MEKGFCRRQEDIMQATEWKMTPFILKTGQKLRYLSLVGRGRRQ